jgi:hypothetical protein
MGKKGMALLISFMMLPGLFASPGVTAAAEAAIVLKLNDVNAAVGETPYLLQSAPVLVNDVTMVPLRFIGDALGASTAWNRDTQTVTLTGPGKTIELSIGEKVALVNNLQVTMEQPAAIMNDTTMVPLRFLAEAMGQTVTFHPELQTITLSKPASAATPAGTPPIPAIPTVDNLIPDPEAGKRIPYATQLIDVAVDQKGYVFSLQKDPNTGYVVKKYDPETGRFQIVFQIDAALNFEYNDLFSNNDFRWGPGNKKTFIYAEFHPDRLYYSHNLDRMYILDGGIAYSLEPQVKLETHPFTLRAMLPYDVDYIGAKIMGKAFFSSMFETVDGETFYLEGDRAIYSSLRGGGTEFVTKTFIDPNSELTSAVKDNAVYTYEASTGAISVLKDSGLKRLSAAPIDGVVSCIGENGSFYVMTADKIYKITVDGEVSTLVDTKKLHFNKGLYKGKGKEYGKLEGADPDGLTYYTYTRFTVDQKDNVILIDQTSRMIRRINVGRD